MTFDDQGWATEMKLITGERPSNTEILRHRNDMKRMTAGEARLAYMNAFTYNQMVNGV